MLDYGSSRSTSIAYGVATVHVPDDHKIGQREVPGYSWWTFSKEPEDPKKHFILNDVFDITKEQWLNALQSFVEKDTAVIFVHGYNITFKFAALRFAQIVWDLQFKGPAVLFSWPSKGETLSYLYDRNSADLSWSRFGKYC